MAKTKRKRKLRKLKIFLATMGVSVGLIGTLLLYNQIKSCSINNADPTIDPFSPDNVFDEDLEFDDNGGLVFDTMTDEEKTILSKQFENLILTDANLRGSEQIEKVEKVLSIHMFPLNQCDENGNNIYNKYYLSIMFTDGEKNYTLNYCTGHTFESNAELTKNMFTDFIAYLSYDCALYSCNSESELGGQISTKLDGDVCFVGNTYAGYRQSGEEIYCIPVYYADGNICMYYATKTLIDMDYLNPMQQLYDELMQDIEKIFVKVDCQNDENMEDFMEIYRNMIGENENNLEK